MDSSPSNSLTTPPYEKSAEFARLYYFFEKLTQPRSCGTSRNKHHHYRSMSHEESETTTAAGAGAGAADAPIPEDFAPLLKNLSAILTKDEPFDHGDGEDEEAQVSIPETPTTAMASTFSTTTHLAHARPISPSDHASTRPRRNTVAVPAALASDHARTTSSDVVSRHVRTQTQTRFPLREKRYPFTFKLLLHKLYDLEDWAAKVQEVLAASQEQFRSLNASSAATTSPTGNNTTNTNTSANGSSSTVTGNGISSSASASGGGVPCSPVSPGTAFSGTVFGLASPPSLESPSAARRRRAQSTSKTKTNASNDVASAGSVLTWCSSGGGGVGPATASRPSQSSRAVKKRIVNRRRSTNGLGGEDVVGKMGEWMYDAAVSSVDAEQVDARGKDGSLRRRKRILSSVGFTEEERRFVGRNVTNVSF